MSNVVVPAVIFPLQAYAEAVFSSAGMASFAFQGIANGQEVNASISVPGSPAGVAWTVLRGGVAIGSMVGSVPFGEFYASNGDVITVQGAVPASETASGLGQAVMLGSQGPLGSLGPVAPTQGGGSGSIFTLLGTLPAGGTSVSVSPNPAAVQLLVFGASSGISCSGNASLLPLAVICGGGLSAIPLPGSQADQVDGYTITLDTAQASAISIYQSGATVIDVVGGGQTAVISLSNPGVGLDFAYEIGGSVRLEALTAILTADATAGNRLPLLELVLGSTTIGYWPGASSALVASKAGFYTWSIGGALSALQVGGGSNEFATAPLPNLELRGAATIKSNTQALDAGDQWSAIVLTFSPI